MTLARTSRTFRTTDVASRRQSSLIVPMKTYKELTPELMQWIRQQHLFFIASAPLNGRHINVSPKGLTKSFALLSSTQFAYLDGIGSGNETLSHIIEPENGRFCIMFCAFEGAAKILRLHCDGKYIRSGTDEFDAFVAQHFDTNSIPTNVYRGVVVATSFLISISCGKGVPFYDFNSERTELGKLLTIVSRKRDRFQNEVLVKNKESLDGLPGVTHTEYLYIDQGEKAAASVRIPHEINYNHVVFVILMSIICFQQFALWNR